jgi:hypothetical protein
MLSLPPSARIFVALEATDTQLRREQRYAELAS